MAANMTLQWYVLLFFFFYLEPTVSRTSFLAVADALYTKRSFYAALLLVTVQHTQSLFSQVLLYHTISDA
jgi:hypothetical protein